MTRPSVEPIFLAGPTAVGKSAVAIELAQRRGGEIISVDSMQVYRGLDIGTAKPTTAERDRVPHHLIDIIPLTATFDVAQFLERARAAQATVEGRGRIPIYCGGTGLYFKALFRGISHAPSPDPALRRALEQTPLSELLEELYQRDPETHERIDRSNARRVIRAVEAIRLSGRPFSAQQSDWHEEISSTSNIFALARDDDDLRARIGARVDRMFAAGLVEEARTLLDAGLAGNRTAMQAIGYRQVVEHLRGVRPIADTISMIKTKTWQFARRQLTWLRHQLKPRWIDVSPGMTESDVADRVEAAIDQSISRQQR